MGALGSGGVRILQPGVPGLMGVRAQDVDAVAARELAELAPRVDALVCLLAPPRFRSVGQWYGSVEQTGGTQVQLLLAESWGGRPAQTTQARGPDHETDDDGYKL